ncbi:hypothetical protein [Virgisporangium aurantiacum]|uniref:Uncharacterized protein n=1 Tax=Virgisporangium aurantiacum TaxID=175570 RepID=A0A8J3ZHZ2_9ACTN|nr:hypothetical protein [Virgisporangium aurantiacum]GIJ63153.1 hypothetical protein Vau01_106690 [Virgisporangium aurantiacum]
MMAKPARPLPAAAALAVLAGILVAVGGAPAAAAPEPAGASVSAATGAVRPEGPLSPSTSRAADRAALADRLDQVREKVAAAQPAAPGGPAAPDAKVGVEPTNLPGAIGTQALLIRRNEANDRATAVSSTLAEPAAANEGNTVFYTGNTYASSSLDNGVNWADVALPAGPADAPNACCDQDVVRAHPRDRFFSILLYTNAALTNGVIRIFVRDAVNAAPLCTYLIDPGGAADNVLPDYPHLALTSGFLYLSSSNLTNGSTWTAAQIRRFDLAQMSACMTATTNTFTHTGTVGQRILTPVEGAANLTTMYFAAIESTSSMRAFTWPESSTTITNVVRTIQTSTFNNPDCRGGTGDFDFIERTTSFSAAGFRMRGAVHGANVTWFWNASAGGGVTQGHVRAASFRRSDMVLLSEPHIFNADHCFGYPTVSGNVFGDLGITIAAGGRAGGGGSAAQGFVGVDDTPADAIHFGTVILTASGTHNRADGRYGDYFTVRTNARCTNAWVATNYAMLNGNTTSAHVNARYVEFGSTLDSACF